MTQARRVFVICSLGLLAAAALSITPLEAKGPVDCALCEDSWAEPPLCATYIMHRQGSGTSNYLKAPYHTTWYCDSLCREHHRDDGACLETLAANSEVESAIEQGKSVLPIIKKHPKYLAIDSGGRVHVLNCAGAEISMYQTAP